MKTKSIRYYYLTSIAAVLVLSTIILGITQTVIATNYFREEKEDLLNQIVMVVSKGSTAGQIGPTAETAQTLEYISRVTDVGVFVADPHGKIIHSTGDEFVEKGTILPQDVMERLYKEDNYNQMSRLGDIYPSNHYIRSAGLYTANNVLYGFVFASADTTLMQVYVTDTVSTFILSALIVFLISNVLALILANRTLTPVRRISEAAAHFAQGDYSARVPVEGDDELAQLAITFNEMANAFETTDISRRSFMGNIAHELRTPMTTIKGFIDGMLDGTIPVDMRDKYLTIVSDEVGRLARLTKNMLDVSRLEAGEYTPNICAFDIWEPISTVALGAEQRLAEKNITLKLEEPAQPCAIMGDEDFVMQILYNLTDNAIKFVEDGGEIAITITPSRSNVTIGVRNSGAGIPPETLPHLFERFYKADKSRGAETRGAGLGLHICKVLVVLMGGRIWAESDGTDYTEFLFSLPAAPHKGKRGS